MSEWLSHWQALPMIGLGSDKTIGIVVGYGFRSWYIYVTLSIPLWFGSTFVFSSGFLQTHHSYRTWRTGVPYCIKFYLLLLCITNFPCSPLVILHMLHRYQIAFLGKYAIHRKQNVSPKVGDCSDTSLLQFRLESCGRSYLCSPELECKSRSKGLLHIYSPF